MKKLLAVLAALAFAAAASAQTYKWVDKDGKVRYGDQPPPGVKATPLRGSSAPAAPAASADTKKDDKKGAKPLSPEAAFRKRQQDQKEAEEKASKERAEGDVRRQNCDVARANLRQLESGQRISSVNAQGERVFIEDNERVAQTQRAQKAVSEYCK
jgi:hypothetical protein